MEDSYGIERHQRLADIVQAVLRLSVTPR